MQARIAYKLRVWPLVIITSPHNRIVSGFVRKPNPCVRLNQYCIIGRAWKAFLGQNSLGILQPNFQLLKKELNYQYLTIFDQIEGEIQLFLCNALCIVKYYFWSWDP